MEDEQGMPSELGGPGEGPSVQISEPTRAGCALVVQGQQVSISKGAAVAVLSHEATIETGASLVAVARELSVDKGGAQWLLASRASMQQSGTGIMISQQVDAPDARAAVLVCGRVTGNPRVGILIAGRVEGEVHAVMGSEAALRFGAALGAVLGLAMIFRRLMARH